MRRLLLAAFILLLLSGCLDGPCGDGGPDKYSVRAYDAGLFAVVHAATPANWTRTPGGGGTALPENATLYRLWGGYTLQDVVGPDTGLPRNSSWEWLTPGHLHFDNWFAGKHQVALDVAVGVPDEAVVPWAERILENVTTMDASARHEWAVRFAATHDDQHYDPPIYQRILDLDAPLALQRTWDRLQPIPDAQGTVPYYGTAQARGWMFRFTIDPIVLNHAGQSLSVGEDDSVSFHGDWKWGINATVALADFDAAYASLGRPPPGDAQFRYEFQC